MTQPVKVKKRRHTTRGALWLIAALLIASGLIRLAHGAGPALARGVEDFAKPQPVLADPLACQPPQDIATVLAALNFRAKTLDQREAALADRTSALALAEGEISRNMAALEAAEAKLSSTLATADQAAEGDLERLTSVYESMKPKEAAALFQEMAPEFAAGFLGRMRADAAAAIMAGLSPQSAYTISVLLAGRNANAPTE